MGDQKGRKKIAIVAVARNLLSIMRAMQLTGELFGVYSFGIFAFRNCT